MRRILIPVLCLAVLGLSANALAGAQDLLVKDGRINSLQDLDYETVIQAGSDDRLVDKGDFLVGMWEVESISYSPILPPPTITTDIFTAVFLLKVKSAARDASGDWIFEFEAATTGEWTTHTGITPNSSDTLGILYNDSTKDFGSKWTNPVPLDGTIKTALGTAAETPLWEFGLTGSDVFWKAKTDTNVVASVAELGYAAALNVTWTYPAASVVLHKHDFLSSASGFTFTGKTQLQLEGDLGSHDPGFAPFTIPTDTDIHIAPTPEPGSLALLGLGLAAIGGVVVRRRRKA